MPEELRECTECKALFTSEEDSEVCERCAAHFADDAAAVKDAITRYNLRTVEEIARFVGMPAERVKRLVDESPALQSRLEEVRLCERCGKEPSAARSSYCILCQMELNSAFRQAVTQLTERVREEKAAKRGKGEPTGLHAETTQKRAKTDHGRLTPRGRYSS